MTLAERVEDLEMQIEDLTRAPMQTGIALYFSPQQWRILHRLYTAGPEVALAGLTLIAAARIGGGSRGLCVALVHIRRKLKELGAPENTVRSWYGERRHAGGYGKGYWLSREGYQWLREELQ